LILGMNVKENKTPNRYLTAAMGSNYFDAASARYWIGIQGRSVRGSR
jgi:hypothetical protein